MTDYRGMSYEAAHKEAQRLMREALKAGRWHHLPEKLKALREIMMQHVERKSA